MGDNRDFFALDWIKSELDTTLNSARRGLEAYAESADEAALRACLAFLHQVNGTLVMLELKGIAVLSAEMESLAEAMLENSLGRDVAVQQLLMQGLLQLPAFLEDIQEGRADRRQVVLPLANEMRTIRGGDPFSDYDASQGNLYQRPSTEALDQFDRMDGREKTAKIRKAYQHVLLSVIKGERLDSALTTLAKVAVGMERLCQGTPISTLFRAFGGFVESLSQGDAHLEKSVIKLLRQIDAELKTIALGGRDALNQPVRLDLIRRLIDAANERNYVSAKLDQISGAIDLADKAEPTGVSSRDAASTAATALREELLQIRDKLDLSVRGEHVELDKLKELAEPLKKIGSTLAVLGYESSRSLIMDQTERLSTFASDGRVSEADLLGVASSLLQVEENLLRITSSRSDESVIQATNSLIGEAQIAVLQEVRNGLEKIKLHVVQFASSQWDIEHLADVPDLLMGTRGALAMIPLSRPAAFLERCANFVQVVWSGGVKPGWQTLDIFADAISGIDYYLERLSENTVPQADDILALVEQSLTRLESLVPTNNLSAEVISQSKTVELLEPDLLETPQSSESAEELLTIKVNQQEKEPTIIGAPVDIGVIPHQHEEPIDRSVEALAQTVEKNIHVEVAQIEFEPSLETSTPIEEVKPEVVVSTDIPENVEPVRERPDEEIIEIFGEEVGEVLESFDKYLPILANDNKEQNRHEALIELRRGFHTLKGSGRIVTADLLAEVSWSIENMLNRLLDGILQRNEHILQIVEEARQLVPLLCSAFERDQEECVDASADLIERADILASGGIPESPDAEAVSEILEDIVGATSSNPSNQSQNAELLVESSSASDDSASWTDDFSMFDEEAVDYMVVLRDFIDRNVDSDKVLLDQDVVRALHTLNGSAGVVGIDPVSAVVGPLYDVMGRLDERGSDLNSDHFVFLQQSVYCLESVLSELRDGRNSEEDGVMYAAEADRLIAEMSAVKSVSILGLDSVPALLELHNYLTHWRGGAEDLDQRDTILVALREIGAHAKESGFGSIVTLSDALRASLLRLKDAVLEEHAFNLLDRAQEVLVSSFDCVAAHQQLPNVDELVDDLFELKSAEKVQIDEVISSDAIVNDLAVPTNISIESDDSFNLDELDIALDQDSVDVPIEMIAENVGKADSTQAVILASESVEAEDPFDIGDLDFGLDEGSVEDYEATDTSTSVQTDIPADGFIESDDLFNLDNLDLGLDEITAKAAAEETPVFEDTASVEEAHRELMADEVLEQDSTDKIDAGQDEYKSIEDIDYIVPMDEMVSTAEEFNPDNSDLEQGEAPVDSAVEEPPKFGGLAFDAVEAAKIEDIAEHDAPLNAADLAADASEHEGLDIPEDLDAEIIEIFFEEADELVETMDQSVNEWVLDSANEMHLENMLRVLHTLKGGARLSGLGKLGDVTHDFESFLVGLQNRDFEPDKAFFSNVLSQVDEVTNLIALYKKAISAPLDEIIPVSATGTESNAEIDAPDKRDERQNIEELNTSGSSIEAEELLESSASADQLTQVDSIGVAQDFDIPLVKQDETVEKDALLQASVVTAIQPTSETTSESVTEPVEVEEAKGIVKDAPKEMVRVSSALLEKLVNLAGESSILRSRVEQTIGDFGQALGEMDITISRLRDQLRRMEIETETQVLFRTELEGTEHETFDPLEMDRYSRMQEIARTLSESTSDMFELKDTLRVKARDSETLLIQQARLNTELQEGLMHTRMVPFGRMLPRLKRIVRQVSQEVGKVVELHALNAEGELDRNIIERIIPPLEHLLRNAIDHGLESAQERELLGKPASGRIEISLLREAGDVVLEVSDDGRGIDTAVVRSKAIERGLMRSDASLSEEEVLQFILAPGFSTAESVTQLSGRGVGMDVVQSEVKRLGGNIEITSSRGKGTRITLRLPFTVSVNRALMVLVGDDQYAIPLNNIEGIVRIPVSEFQQMNEPDSQTFEYAGIPYRLRYLGNYLGREFSVKPDQASVPVVLVRSGDRAMALYINSVQGSREIIVKSLGQQFAGVGGLSGATILGDGSVVVILDVISLIAGHRAETKISIPEVDEEETQNRCVMVVDDSVTVRKVTSRILERQGMDVIVAKDGVEAMELLQEKCPDVMLLDIEMPRMDGFEVARQIRHDATVSNLPIIMISSRTGAKHQEHAGALGVNKFLGKPFQESELLTTIDELLVAARPQRGLVE